MKNYNYENQKIATIKRIKKLRESKDYNNYKNQKITRIKRLKESKDYNIENKSPKLQTKNCKIHFHHSLPHATVLNRCNRQTAHQTGNFLPLPNKPNLRCCRSQAVHLSAKLFQLERLQRNWSAGLASTARSFKHLLPFRCFPGRDWRESDVAA